MLVNVGLNEAQHRRIHLRLRRVIQRQVGSDVSVLILLRKCLRGLLQYETAVFSGGILWLRHRQRWQNGVDVLDVHRHIHAPIRFLNTLRSVNLGVALHHLHQFLCQRNALTHGKNVGIRDGNDVNAGVEISLFDGLIAICRQVRVHRGQSFRKDLSQ